MGIAYASLGTQLAVSITPQQLVSGNGKLSQLVLGQALCDGAGGHDGHHDGDHDGHGGHGPPDPPPVGGTR
jgi:hypothetical protein